MILVPTPQESEQLNQLVEHYQRDLDGRRLIPTFWTSLQGYIEESTDLKKCIHSVRSRLKDPTHLADKLLRKLREAAAAGHAFDINTDNLFVKINDLAGIRILHLHTRQVADIDKYLKQIIEEQAIELIEGPSARTWDDEYRSLFKEIGIETKSSENMYTSVHYVVASKSKTTVTCEIQVRTLMEEVWGEVDHSIDYPHKTDSVACREQIRALARSTSSATRLVDSIFATFADFQRQKK